MFAVRRRGFSSTLSPSAGGVLLFGRDPIVIQSSSGGGSGLYRASSYPLAITFPKAVGASPSGLDADNRCFNTYTGLEMTLPLCAVHGTSPYVWSGSNLPSGAVVEQFTNRAGRLRWRFRWPSPSGTATPTFRCTDYSGTALEETITISANTTSTRYRFVDSVNGDDANPGSLAEPWRTLAPVQNIANTAGGGDWHVIFRTGTYYVTDMPSTASSGVELRVDMSESGNRPNIWYSYPGERAVIDFGQVGGSQAPRIRFTTANHVFMQNLDFRNGYVMGLQIFPENSRGFVIDNCTFDELVQFSAGSNQAHIMTNGGSGLAYGICIVNSDLGLPGNENVANAIKLYYTQNALIEGNYFHDIETAIETKESNESFCHRGNLFDNIEQYCFAGDWADNEGLNGTFGDICYNQHLDPTTTYFLRLNNGRTGGDGHGRVDAFRNTANAGFYLPYCEATQGPVLFAENVIRAATPIVIGGSVNPARYTATDNLEGAVDDARVDDTTGELSGDWAQYNYQRGHRVEE